jgi:hypothetical protein
MRDYIAGLPARERNDWDEALARRRAKDVLGGTV